MGQATRSDKLGMQLRFPEVVEALKSNRFKEALSEALYSCSERLPLDELCQYGGWPEDVCITVLSFHSTDNCITTKVEAAFAEVLASSCQDISHSRSHVAALDVTIDVQTAEADVTLNQDRSQFEVEGTGDYL